MRKLLIAIALLASAGAAEAQVKYTDGPFMSAYWPQCPRPTAAEDAYWCNSNQQVAVPLPKPSPLKAMAKGKVKHH
jgi:hypothetical protein